MVCLVLNLGACSVNLKPKISETGVDICKTDLKIFRFTDEEFSVLETHNIKNAVLVNCILAVKCGINLSNEYECTN